MVRDRIHRWSVHAAERVRQLCTAQHVSFTIAAAKRVVRTAWLGVRTRHAQAQRPHSAAPSTDEAEPLTDHKALRDRHDHCVRFVRAQLLTLDAHRLVGDDAMQEETL